MAETFFPTDKANLASIKDADRTLVAEESSGVYILKRSNYSVIKSYILNNTNPATLGATTTTSLTPTGTVNLSGANVTGINLDNGSSNVNVDNKVNGVLRFRHYMDAINGWYRVHTYNSSGVFVGEMYRMTDTVFNINPNNVDIDTTIENLAGTAILVNDSSVIINVGNVDIDFVCDTLSTNNAFWVNAGSNLVQVQVPLLIGTGTAPRIISGSGSPEGVQSAVVGSLYLRTNGGATSTLYVKESGSGNTGWVAK